MFYFRIMSPLHQLTPLHLAAERGRYNLVKYLVDQSADVNIQDLDGVKLQTTSAYADLIQFIPMQLRKGAVSNYAV